jgi:hypothetical protein
MTFVEHVSEGRAMFTGNIEFDDASGTRGFTVRIVPRHENLVSPFLPGLITWAQA